MWNSPTFEMPLILIDINHISNMWEFCEISRKRFTIAYKSPSLFIIDFGFKILKLTCMSINITLICNFVAWWLHQISPTDNILLICSGHTTPDIECSSDIGAVTSLKVRKEGANGWLMTHAEVTDAASMVTVTFTCNCFLDNDAGTSLEHTLNPTAGKQS